jgi:hypothetical protein
MLQVPGASIPRRERVGGARIAVEREADGADGGEAPPADDAGRRVVNVPVDDEIGPRVADQRPRLWFRRRLPAGPRIRFQDEDRVDIGRRRVDDEEIVGRRRAAGRRHAMRKWQVGEPRRAIVADPLAGPNDRRGGAGQQRMERRRVGQQQPVGVAVDRRDRERAHPFERFARPGSEQGEVAGDDRRVVWLFAQVGENRFERGGVAMHVRDDRDDIRFDHARSLLDSPAAPTSSPRMTVTACPSNLTRSPASRTRTVPPRAEA